MWILQGDTLPGSHPGPWLRGAYGFLRLAPWPGVGVGVWAFVSASHLLVCSLLAPPWSTGRGDAMGTPPPVHPERSVQVSWAGHGQLESVGQTHGPATPIVQQLGVSPTDPGPASCSWPEYRAHQAREGAQAWPRAPGKPRAAAGRPPVTGAAWAGRPCCPFPHSAVSPVPLLSPGVVITRGSGRVTLIHKLQGPEGAQGMFGF